MNRIFTATGDLLLGIEKTDDHFFSGNLSFNEYVILYITDGKGVFHSDFGTFPFEGPVLLFATPLQTIRLEGKFDTAFEALRFHGDFYCIEYHRKEVACNGLLFNNVYLEPSVFLTAQEAQAFGRILEDIRHEFAEREPAEMILRAYLQLFLAKASHAKTKQLSANQNESTTDEQMERFRELLDEHYLDLHRPQDYARLLAMSPNNFTKRCTRYFKKPPSALIQERLILEAKRQLHLTRKSIKEIAWALKFEDEFYFSRVFKKFTKVSPQNFRDRTGISIVADLSM